MPSAGYSHFYLSAEETAQLKQLGVCQCPRLAILISTRRYGTPLRTLQRCQCPRRAILISTVPSGSPHKYWLSSPIFAGICLNILKSSIFPLFLVLFIICSYLDTFYTSSDTVNIILYLPI